MTEQFYINVGGVSFHTTIETLHKHSPNYFTEYNLAKERLLMIDRDPEVFPYILNWMRGYKLVRPATDRLRQMMIEDSKFYKLPELTEQLTRDITMNKQELLGMLQNLRPAVPEEIRKNINFNLTESNTIGEIETELNTLSSIHSFTMFETAIIHHLRTSESPIIRKLVDNYQSYRHIIYNIYDTYIANRGIQDPLVRLMFILLINLWEFNGVDSVDVVPDPGIDEEDNEIDSIASDLLSPSTTQEVPDMAKLMGSMFTPPNDTDDEMTRSMKMMTSTLLGGLGGLDLSALAKKP